MELFAAADRRPSIPSIEARPLLGSVSFSDERIDELADAVVTSRIGERTEQFVNWALAQGPIGLDPEAGF
jgi:hypothetical protein